MALGVVLGPVLGKHMRVTGASGLAIRFGRAGMPEAVNWRQPCGVAFPASIGFTVSLFMTDLAFADERIVASAKVGILVASVLAGVPGFLVLHRSLSAGAAPGGGDSHPAHA